MTCSGAVYLRFDGGVRWGVSAIGFGPLLLYCPELVTKRHVAMFVHALGFDSPVDVNAAQRVYRR